MIKHGFSAPSGIGRQLLPVMRNSFEQTAFQYLRLRVLDKIKKQIIQFRTDRIRDIKSLINASVF